MSGLRIKGQVFQLDIYIKQLKRSNQFHNLSENGFKIKLYCLQAAIALTIQPVQFIAAQRGQHQAG